MKIIDPSIEIIDCPDGEALLKMLEYCGRVCYKSEDKITEDSAKRFISSVLKSGHESVLEHAKITVKVICDRGVTHEIVRHRLASYSQESTRYCNYSNEKFGSELTFINPCFWDNDDDHSKRLFNIWVDEMQRIEDAYNEMIQCGARPEEARTILPNSLKTEIVITMNIREWRHFFKMRCSSRAHPQMRQVANMIKAEFQSRIPLLFDDVKTQET